MVGVHVGRIEETQIVQFEVPVGEEAQRTAAIPTTRVNTSVIFSTEDSSRAVTAAKNARRRVLAGLGRLILPSSSPCNSWLDDGA
jgi:hypothetical protein